MKTVNAIRVSFWEAHPQYLIEYRKTKRHNEYSCDVRCAFGEHVDNLHRDGQISDALANRATL